MFSSIKAVKKKGDWSTDESVDSDNGNQKQHRRTAKRVSEKHRHVRGLGSFRISFHEQFGSRISWFQNKNINMEDVFGADSTDNEKGQPFDDKEKKRKKTRKVSRGE